MSLFRKHRLIGFDCLFVPDLSFKSIFAQNKSCRSFFPLQLLFWPNFELPYQNLRIGGSKPSQIIQFRYCFALFSTVWAPTPIPTCWPSTSSSTRRRSRPGDPRRPSAVLIIASTLEPSRPIPFLSFFLSARRDRAELAAARPPGPSSPPLSNPSRPELRNLAPTLLHLSSTSAVPKPGRNRAPVAARHRRFPWTSALSVEPSPPVHLRPNRAPGELHRALLSLPDPFPAGIRHHRLRSAAAPPWLRRRPPCARRRLPLLQTARRCSVP